MFSAPEAPSEQPDIDWLDDLKFFIDNDDRMLSNYFFPAVDKHKMHQGNPNAYKLYLKAIEHCKDHYCKKYEIEEPQDKFPKDKLITLAKMFADEQERHIKDDNYAN